MQRFRFYCPECDRFIDRRKVYSAEDYTVSTKYFCKWCDSPVIQTRKVVEEMVRDALAYERKTGGSIERFE